MFRKIVEAIRGIKLWARFTLEVFQLFLKKGVDRNAFVSQMYEVGSRSLPITIVAGVFVGAILAIQINLQLKDFGAQSFLGGLSTSTTLRNLGPVLIAFILAGRVGAFTSAELGTMAITDQLNAIRCLGMNPLSVIVVPRLLALIVSSFLLLILGLAMTVLGGAVIAAYHLGVNPVNFATNIPRFVSFGSVFLGVVKSFIFGVMIGSISCYFGYSTSGGASEVGKAVKSTSVVTLISIIVMDFLVSVTGESLSRLLQEVASL